MPEGFTGVFGDCYLMWNSKLPWSFCSAAPSIGQELQSSSGSSAEMPAAIEWGFHMFSLAIFGADWNRKLTSVADRIGVAGI